MKKRFIRVSSLLLAGSLSILGFSASGQQLLLYGGPPNYERPVLIPEEKKIPEINISGTITDASSKSLKGIKVTINGQKKYNIVTDENGNFNITVVDYSKYVIIFSDPSGIYKSKKIKLTAKQMLSEGEYAVNVVLKKNKTARVRGKVYSTSKRKR